MVDQVPYIQIFKDLPEELSHVSLRHDPSTGTHVAVMRFQSPTSIENFLAFRRSSVNAIHLIDSEGEILVEPAGVRMYYSGPEGEDLKGFECKVEIDRSDHWDRFMRFMHRYAEAHGMAHWESKQAAYSANGA
ncbi:MAG: photosystem II reaction center protein Psb28 [Cyanobacteria bacterium J06554_6]